MVSAVNQKGDSAQKWVAEAASSKNSVNFLWWGCLISYVIPWDGWQIIFLLFEVAFWVSMQCCFLLFILLSPPLLFLGATVSLWKVRLWNTLCDSLCSVAQLVTGQSRLGFLFSFILWRELTHSSLIFSPRLFVSQITIKAQSFWAAEALLLLPTQDHAFAGSELIGILFFMGNLPLPPWTEALLQHEAT